MSVRQHFLAFGLDGGFIDFDMPCDFLSPGVHTLANEYKGAKHNAYDCDASDVDELSFAHLCMDDAFGKRSVINSLLGLVGIGPLKMLNTQGAIVLGMVYNYLPYMILPLYSVMVKIDDSVLEAAQDLGCGRGSTIMRVVVPLSLPGIMSGITMVFVPAISTFIISRMLGGGSNLLIGDLIEMQFLGNAYNPNLGAAISLVLMVIVLIIMAVMHQFDSDDDDRVLL